MRNFYKLKNIPIAMLLVSATAVQAAGNDLPSKENEAKGSIVETQQNKTINGTVFDETGAPLIGATITVEGTTKGTITGVGGTFSLESVAVGAIINVNYMGYVTQEITVTAAASDLKITLEQDGLSLDEVVVVGYGVQRKESVTGALQTIGSEKLTDITTPSVENMLNSKAPGVFVSPGAGPGAVGKVMIRGKSTINGSTDPLWVVDGVIIGSDPGALNPADIEDMTILKDAASTAIYGSQGANGVILITTKQARGGDLTVSASVKAGISQVHNGNLELHNGAELYDYYASFQNQESINFARWNEDLRNSNFDWWDEATQVGVTQDYNVSVSGGTEKLQSYFSLGLYDEEGAIKGYDYRRYNMRFRSDYKPFDFLTIKPMVSGSVTDIDNRQHSTSAMYTQYPWDNPYDAEGNPVGHQNQDWVNSSGTNYLYDLQYNWSKSSKQEFMGNIDLEADITDWLKFVSVNSYRYINYQGKSYTDPRSSGGEGVDGRINQSTNKSINRYTNQYLNFIKSFGDHHVTGTLGYEFKDYYYENLNGVGIGFVPGYEVLDITATPEKVAGLINESAMQSVFFKASYSYKYKYLIEASVRRDGASNFGVDDRYGNFYSVSAGWNIEKEDFFNVDWINTLKLRASYGTVGNIPTSLYPSYDLYSLTYQYNQIPGALISQIGNKNLTWEGTKTTGVGIDFSAFDNRLRITADYYNKLTDRLLYAVPVSAVIGVTSIWRNVGAVENNGFELMIGGDILRKSDLVWSLDVNLATNKNEVKELYGGQDEIVISGGSGIAGAANRLLTPGMDADTWYIPIWAGVNPETGAPQWYKVDENGEQVITEKHAEATYQTAGSYNPDLFGGVSTFLQYKNFDLSASFGFSLGGEIYNYSRTEYDSDGAYIDRNQMKLMDDWNRWEKPGDIATHPVAVYGNKSGSNKVSTRYLEDGSYLKLRSLTIGYNFKIPQLNGSNLRVFFTGENLFTITGYSGVDPELSPLRGTTIGGEASSGLYPSIRKFMFGVNITL